MIIEGKGEAPAKYRRQFVDNLFLKKKSLLPFSLSFFFNLLLEKKLLRGRERKDDRRRFVAGRRTIEIEMILSFLSLSLSLSFSLSYVDTKGEGKIVNRRKSKPPRKLPLNAAMRARLCLLPRGTSLEVPSCSAEQSFARGSLLFLGVFVLYKIRIYI